MKARFDGRVPYIKYARGENSGLVGFYKPLSEEDIEYIKTTITKINSYDVTWSIPSGKSIMCAWARKFCSCPMQKKRRNNSRLSVRRQLLAMHSTRPDRETAVVAGVGAGVVVDVEVAEVVVVVAVAVAAAAAATATQRRRLLPAAQERKSARSESVR